MWGVEWGWGRESQESVISKSLKNSTRTFSPLFSVFIPLFRLPESSTVFAPHHNIPGKGPWGGGGVKRRFGHIYERHQLKNNTFTCFTDLKYNPSCMIPLSSLHSPPVSKLSIFLVLWCSGGSPGRLHDPSHNLEVRYPKSSDSGRVNPWLLVSGRRLSTSCGLIVNPDSGNGRRPEKWSVGLEAEGLEFYVFEVSGSFTLSERVDITVRKTNNNKWKRRSDSRGPSVSEPRLSRKLEISIMYVHDTHTRKHVKKRPISWMLKLV